MASPTMDIFSKRSLTINTNKTRHRSIQEESEKKGSNASNGSWKGELGEPVSPAGRLFHEPRSNCKIVAIMGTGTPIDLEAFVNGLEATQIKHPRFSSIQVIDESNGRKQLRWAPVKVNVKDHIIIPSLSTGPSSSLSSNDRLVEDYASSLSVTSMDLGRPFWEFHILNIPTTESASTIIMRIHHSLGDGMSLISLLLACTRLSVDPASFPSIPEPPRRSGPIAQSRRGQELGFWPAALSIFSPVVLVWNTIVDMVLFTATSCFFKDSETPLKGQEGAEFHKKRFVHVTIQLDDIKNIKNAFGCTVNDVFIGITSAALSQYIHKKHSEEKDRKSPPKELRVRSALLVNIRPSPGIHALTEMMSEGGKDSARFGNYIGCAILEIPIVNYDDPLDYVREGKVIGKRKKNSFESVLSYMSIDLIIKLFGLEVASYLSNRVLMNTTLSFSNITGPQEEISLYGHPIVYIAPSVYGHPHALTVHYQSYNNKIKLVLAVDESVISDPHQLLDDFVKSLDNIVDATSKLTQKNENSKPN